MIIPDDIFQIVSFIASIAIVFLLVIEANVLLRLLPIIKKSAENTSRVADTFEKGGDILSKHLPDLKNKFTLQIPCKDTNPNHIHTPACFL